MAEQFSDTSVRAFAQAEMRAIEHWQQATYKEAKNMGLLNTLGRLVGYEPVKVQYHTTEVDSRPGLPTYYYDSSLSNIERAVMDVLRQRPTITNEDLGKACPAYADAFPMLNLQGKVQDFRVGCEAALDKHYPGWRTGASGDGAAGAGVPARPAPSSSGPATIELKIPGRPARLTTSSMTQEQLRQRRTNMIENASFGRPVHEHVMLFVLKLWLLIGPFAFVLLTTSEVAYILTHLAAPGSGTLIIWGGALFIDLAMMFTTFGVALKRRDVAEKREAYGAVSKRAEAEVWMGTAMWLVFAAINIISQSAFLLHIIQGSHDPNMNLLYLFVGSRVTGFILGDATTAFFLAKVDNSAIKLIARAEREKAALYSDIAKAEGERQLVEAKAEAEISLIRIRVQQEQEDAEFLAELKRQVFTDILSRRQLPPPSEPTKLDGPRGARRLGD